MFTNYPARPTQQEMDDLYKTHQVEHSILSNMLLSDTPNSNNRIVSQEYKLVDLLKYDQPAAELLYCAEQRIRSEVFCLNPTRLVEVEKITVEALEKKLIDPLGSAIEDSHRMSPVVGGVEYHKSYQGPFCGNPCLIMNKMAQTDLRVSGAIDKDTNQIFGYPIFIVEGGNRSEVMLFSGHSIYYSNMIPESFLKEAAFGGANIYRFGPYLVEIIRRVSPMGVNTHVVLHSNLGLKIRDRALIWKMVTKI